MDRVITEEGLRANDGQESPGGAHLAFVAYQGKVYDVSTSKMWRGGVHMRRHHAGSDLTADLAAAPHDASVFQRPTVTLVGDLAPVVPVQAVVPAELPAWLEWLLNRHPHPISVHFPIAFAAAVVVFLVLYLLTGNRSFELSGYYLLWGGVVLGAVAMVLGVTSWYFNHGHKAKAIYLGKIALSFVFLVIGIVALSLRTANTEALVSRDGTGWAFFALTAVMLVVAALLGWLGDIIMWGGK